MSLQPEWDAALHLQSVAAADFESLLALRIRAMQPSLEALGRFDPARARERFASSFMAEHMQHIALDADGVSQRVGCVTLRPKPGALRMDHLYIEPSFQNQGIGAWVMDWACSTADLRQQPLELAALQGSDSNRFYQRHGLVEVSRSDFDIDYRRAPCASPLQVVRDLWACVQARNWAGMRALLHDDARVRWWASGETLNAEAFVRVNAEYPEGWTVHVQQLHALQDGRVLALVQVDHPPGCFLAQSLTRVRHGRIAAADEWWATCEAPPAWRNAARFAGLEQTPGWASP